MAMDYETRNYFERIIQEHQASHLARHALGEGLTEVRNDIKALLPLTQLFEQHRADDAKAFSQIDASLEVLMTWKATTEGKHSGLRTFFTVITTAIGSAAAAVAMAAKILGSGNVPPPPGHP